MDLARTFCSKKYMWDGNELESKEQAESVKKQYADDGFEVEIVEEDGKQYLFTRREVKEVIVEGNPI